MTLRRLVRPALLLAVLLGVPVLAQQNNEELARRQYESGLTFLRNGRNAEGVKDLQAVVDSFGTSAVADNALLRIAQYHLEGTHDLAAAEAAIERLLKDYPDTDAAPMAHVLGGRVTFAKGRTASEVDSALASFERVPRLFPGDEAVAAAGFYAGETLRALRRDADALERYRRVTMEFPRSEWSALAAVSAGYCLVQEERPTQALQEFQRARLRFPGTPSASEALNGNSIVYRLYVRTAAQQPAFTFNGRLIGPERSELRDASALRFAPDGRLMLGHKNGVAIFKPDGTAEPPVPAQDASAFFLDEENRVVVARNATLIVPRGETITFSAPGSDNQLHAIDDIPAVLPNDRGERLIANPKGRNVVRVLPSGRFVAVFATGTIARMAQNALGDVALLDRSAKTVTLADSDGKILTRIATRGTGYELNSPTDVAFDSLGHVYVLDRGRSSVFVFAPKGKLVTTLAIPDRSPGSLSRGEALGLDAAGRLYVFDDRSRRIQVYQ
ncbi:MAG: tetratricopeptide repeat protein [Vicinamibacterales bacterium]